MLFNSLPFLYLFLPVTWLVFGRLRSAQQRYAWLTLTGYVFYAFWNWKFCLLMAFSTLVSYSAGRALADAPPGRRRQWLLVLPIAVDLSLLGYFKYANFVLHATESFARLAGAHWVAPTLNIVLPVGISFYTFHTITYIVDSYRGVIRPTKNLLEFSTYVSLFAQLVAGPIVRFRQIERDLERLDRPPPSWYESGCSFFVLGLAKKVLIADTIARHIDPLWAASKGLTSLNAWLCAVGYTYQLYFDFSGYSDMAVGLGLFFGLRLPQNFDSPYRATDPGDFWRRWHISLSSVLRDYLYIPLGGSRVGTLKTYRNLMLTMLLGGLWHGANWTFVLWGGYHGLLLCLHRLAAGPWDKLPVLLRRATTFFFVVVGWVFFRSPTVDVAWRNLLAMFVHRKHGPMLASPGFWAMLPLAALLAHVGPNTFELSHQWDRLGAAALVIIFCVVLLVITAGNDSPFLYFQF